MSFESLRKNKKDNFQKLQDAANQLQPKTYEADPDDWYPGVDKAGNGQVKLRFLPPVSDDDVAFIRSFRHEFQDKDTGKWYIENCLSTLHQGGKLTSGIDPVLDFNTKLWNSTKEDKHPNRLQAAEQKRKVNYRTNIFIIEDENNPENNGKTKKFKFGKIIWDMINGAMFPKFKGEEPLNVFDLDEGAAFNLRIFSEKKDGKMQRNYSGSRFDTTRGPLASDKEMKKIYESIAGWSLKAYHDPKNFQSYEDLKARLDLVVGYNTAEWGKTTASAAKNYSTPSAVASKATKEVSEKIVKENEEDSGDFFKNLVDDDIPF